MNPDEWAEVFSAGADAISGIGMIREDGLPPDLYGAAAVSRALQAMAARAREISLGADGF